jgi:hypothetical protein
MKAALAQNSAIAHTKENRRDMVLAIADWGLATALANTFRIQPLSCDGKNS